MWEWIMQELNRQALAVSGTLSKDIRDDIVQNVCVELCKNQILAKEIYEKKQIRILYKMIKHEVYNITSKKIFHDKMEYSRYQKIIEICEKYNIPKDPKYAYKIAALLEENSNITCKGASFSIQGVKSILNTAEPLLNGYSSREQKFIEPMSYEDL